LVNHPSAPLFLQSADYLPKQKTYWQNVQPPKVIRLEAKLKSLREPYCSVVNVYFVDKWQVEYLQELGKLAGRSTKLGTVLFF